MSSERNSVYRCEHCGLMVETIRGAAPAPSCCGETMTLVKENTQEAATEKHIPVVEKVNGGYKVTVGSVAHPMVEKHYIEWIELILGDRIYRQYLLPDSKPEAFFALEEDGAWARAYCNLHALWKS